MNLDELMDKVKGANKTLQSELEVRWPKDSRVQVFLSCNQITASDGTVVSHDGSDGTIRVSIDRKPDYYGRYQRAFVRNIHYRDVVSP